MKDHYQCVRCRSTPMPRYHLAKANLVRLGVTEYEPGKFSAEASTLGWPPGQWPARVETDMGNGQAFLPGTRKLSVDQALLWVTYLQSNGCISLRVYND